MVLLAQGVFNYGLCPHWFRADAKDTTCGRLPGIFNVQSYYFKMHHHYSSIRGLSLPTVIHFTGDVKPWHLLRDDYSAGVAVTGLSSSSIPECDLMEVLKQSDAHMLWRHFYFRASGRPPPQKSIFFDPTVVSLFELDKFVNNEYYVMGSGKVTKKKKKKKSKFEVKIDYDGTHDTV